MTTCLSVVGNGCQISQTPNLSSNTCHRPRPAYFNFRNEGNDFRINLAPLCQRLITWLLKHISSLVSGKNTASTSDQVCLKNPVGHFGTIMKSLETKEKHLA